MLEPIPFAPRVTFDPHDPVHRAVIEIAANPVAFADVWDVLDPPEPDTPKIARLDTHRSRCRSSYPPTP